MYRVQKKDGTIEDFDRNKIIQGVVRAGATPEEAEKVASAVEAWLPSVAVDNVVKSEDIRTKGLAILEELNPTAVANFKAYQKPA